MRAPEFWDRDGAMARLLAPLGFFQGASVAWKARHARPFRVKAKVVCVGNLTVGGSGKTPIAIALAEALAVRGKNLFFLTRGYGGRESGPHRVVPGDDAYTVGDEALLLTRTAPTVVARDRRAGAMLADGADVIVMDDGHQNFALAKDLSIVVVDSTSKFGNGFVIPAGPLREPVTQGLARADAVVMIGSETNAGDPTLAEFSGPVLRARLAPDAASLAGRRVFAFAGIGRPEKFADMLRACGAEVTGARFFADHHFYRDGEIARLKAEAGDAMLVTTEKDFMRLSPSQTAQIAVVRVKAAFTDTGALAQLLDRLDPAV